MSKGNRIKVQHSEAAVALYASQKEELIQQLAMQRINTQRMTVVMGCLVKRLGKVLPDDRGWRVLVTDEEFEALNGELEVHRNEGAMGIVLTLKSKEDTGADVGEDQGERNLDLVKVDVQTTTQEVQTIMEETT